MSYHPSRTNYIPAWSEPVTIWPGHDHVFSRPVTAIRANRDGSFLACLSGDIAAGNDLPVLYTVTAGEYLPGAWYSVVFFDIRVGAAGTTSTLAAEGDLLGVECGPA